MSAKRLGDRLLLAASFALAILWLGMLTGVSFVATPVKFTAPSLELGPALEVGRATFALFSRLEWGLALLVAAATSLAPAPRPLLLPVVALAVIIVFQAGWLLPALDARVAAVLTGTAPPPSWHHAGYALLEGAKALLLLSIALIAAARLAKIR
ncbi:MAG: hypothetical protein Tsb0032_11450 [Kiloniellaceae bacterium]